MTGNPKAVVIDSAPDVMPEMGLAEGLPRVAELILKAATLLERIVKLQAGIQQPAERRDGRAGGNRTRTLSVAAGKLALVAPHARMPAESVAAAQLESGSRVDRALKAAIAETCLQGAATRRVRAAMELIGGSKVSSERVGRLTAQLDEEFGKWRNRPLPAIAYLVLDASGIKVRHQGGVHDCVALVAIGVRRDNGKRMVLGVEAAVADASGRWQGFLGSLLERGAGVPDLVTSEDFDGLGAALRGTLGDAPWQCCQSRLLDDARDQVRAAANCRSVVAEIQSVFGSPDLSRAEARLAEVVEKHRKSAPELAKWMAAELPQGLTIFRLPEHCRRRLRTSNMAEGIKQQIKRRTRVIGLLPNVASALRLVTAVLIEASDEWETGRAYLTLAPQG
jgi:transposase-like protein